MISISKLRQATRLGADRDHELTLHRDSVIALWEQTTKGLWNAREGHVQLKELTTDRRRRIGLELRPVTSVTTVEAKSPGDSSWTTLTTKQYEVVNSTLLRVGRFWSPLVRITYDGGYSATTCPEDIQNALLLQVRFAMERHQGEGLISRSRAIAGGSNVQFLEQAYVHPTFKAVARHHTRKSVT